MLSKKPVWFEPLIKNPPLADYTPPKDPGVIVFPEDPYMSEVYKRRPEIKYEAFDPSTFESSAARKLAHRVMELVDLGIPKNRAFDIADAEYWNIKRVQNRAYDEARLQAIREGREPPPPRKMYRRVQELERKYLKEGLKKLKLQKEAAEAAMQVSMAPRFEDMEDEDYDD